MASSLDRANDHQFFKNDEGPRSPLPHSSPTPVRNTEKRKQQPVQDSSGSDRDLLTCQLCTGCIRPPLHEGICMDGQCNEILANSPVAIVESTPAVKTKSPRKEESFSIGDRVRSKRHGKEGVVIAVDSAGDPKVLYDGEAVAQGKKGKYFELLHKDTDGSFLKHLKAARDDQKAAEAEEEARRKTALQKATDEREARKKLAEQEARAKVMEEERKAAEEEALRKAAEEETVRKAEAEEKARKEAPEIARREAAHRKQEKKEERELAQMDERCVNCFLDCATARDPPRTPMKGTMLYTKYIRPSRPAGTSVDVKDSNFKSLGNFMRFLEEEGLLCLKPGLTDPVVTEIRRSACSNYEYVSKYEPLSDSESSELLVTAPVQPFPTAPVSAGFFGSLFGFLFCRRRA